MGRTNFRVLALGAENEVLDFLKERLTNAEYKLIRTSEEWENGLADFSDAGQDVIICGSDPIGVGSLEIAQCLLSMCPNTPLIYASFTAADMTVKSLRKNGFQNVYLMPTDRPLFKEQLARLEHLKTGQSKKVFRGVTLCDVSAGDTLDFSVSVYLPLNNKYVCLSKGGDVFDQKKFDRLHAYEVSKVYVDVSQMGKFYKYTADKLKLLNQPNSKMSETERVERLTESVRKIILDLFDSSEEISYDQGRALMEDTQRVISEMIGIENVVDIHRQLADALKQPSESTTRGNRVSTFAALFEMIVGLKKTQMAAVAGMFCDVGISSLPREIQVKSLAEMTADERKQFEGHPAASLRLMQSKKMVVPPDVQNAILHHHERLDGSGYPAKLSGAKIPALSQLVALADRFEELTCQDNKAVDLNRVFAQLSKESICTFDMLECIRRVVLKSKEKAA